MTLKTGMLVGIVGSEDMGVLIQIRASSNTCVIKLNNGTLKKNVPLEDVEEAKDMSDTKEKKSPIRLGGGGASSPGKSPAKLAALSVDTRMSTAKLKTELQVGDAVRARCNGGSRWFPGKILRVHREGTYDVEYDDGDVEKKMAAVDVEAALKSEKTMLKAPPPRKKVESLGFEVGDKIKARYKNGAKLFSGKISRVRSDGTYDVVYDDGDTELRVPKDRIEADSKASARKKESDDEAPSTKKKSSAFSVNQSVKARYKGGKKLFSGKIKRVHSDGTYDVLYDDGDEEKRVKPENIEATGDPKADSGEDRKPAKSSSSRLKLTVGKKVKARYKKGKRLFPGKISRVRPDGTYDIEYDDGEVETRVEANQIEASDEEDLFADSDDDIQPKKAPKKKGSSWEIGERINAFYGKGKRLFPGKIAKIHMNGTYDIKYDDGDSEMRVDASLIEAADPDPADKEKPASKKAQESPKASVKSSSKRPLRVGDAVKAKYKRGARFFPGTITRERMDGTFDVKYEDGDVEERVQADSIQRVDEPDEVDEKTKKKAKKSFEVGDVVNAPFQRGTKLFRGKITRARSDGTYDISFDDGDRDTHVPGDLIKPEKEDQDVKPKQTALKVGDAVKARYQKGKKLFSGTVTRARSDGTYDIKYDDGDVEMHVGMEMIEVPDSRKADDEERSDSPKSLKVGDKVRARYNKGSKMFSGEITAVHRDGTYAVRYDDGDKEKHVEVKDIELEKGVRDSQSPKISSSLKVGDKVEASYKNGAKMFPGSISRVHSDGTYDVKFEDGDSERRVPMSRIKPKEGKDDRSDKKRSGFAAGDAVKAKYKKGSKFFPGKIVRARSDGTYDVEYEDGDSETRVDAALIVAVEPATTKASENSPKLTTKAKRFEVGDVIKARYKKGTKLFPGKVTRVRSDGTYDVRYDDGDTEMYVENSFIEGEDKPKADDKKKETFAVGDKVKSRYKGGLKMYPGKIIKARMDGTFDIEYDDGDVELRVSSSSIELIPGAKTKKPEAKSGSDKDDLFGDSDSDGKGKKPGNKKSSPMKVGDIVEADFKRKGKFHRGKIVRVRSDGTFDIEYDVGASEKHVRSGDIKKIGGNQDDSGGEASDAKKKKHTPAAGDESSDSDQESRKVKEKKSSKKPKHHSSSSESSGSDREKQLPIQKGTRVTYRKAEDAKTRRVGTVKKVHSDASCDVKYKEGDTTKRIARKLLVECSDSEDSDEESTSKESLKRRRSEGPTFRRHERVMSNWRRSSKLSKPRMADKWIKATVLEKNADGTYTIRYCDGVVEEDVPSEALKTAKKKNASGSDSNSGKSDASGRRRKRKVKRDRSTGIGTESLFLLEQLAMTLFEEGVMKKKPKLQLLRDGNASSSSESSSSSSTESGSGSSKKKNAIDKVLKRLFDASTLQNYRQIFKESDVKSAGKVSRSKIIRLVEEFIAASRPTKESGKASHKDRDEKNSVSHILTEWFATHDDLRTHRNFDFKTLMIAFAYAKCRLGKLRMEQSVATVLEGRFASFHENKRQLELWQQKLGFRLFETLQRHFHDNALPNMIPSRLRVSELSLIFEQVARHAVPNKPLDVYMQQHQLFPHHTLQLAEFLCCYYQLYGSENPASSRWSGAVELRPVAFVASCLFSNGDNVCRRHGDLVRRLSVGRTQAQADLILRFREAFESLLSTEVDSDNSREEQLLETSQLSAFAAKVAPDPTLLEPAMTLLRKRSASVSLVEVFGSCGFVIDELTSAPTIRNAIEKMRMRVDLAEVRRIIGLVRNICVKILRFPNNPDYWRIRSDNAAFQQKIGRFDGATSLLEAVGFVEYQKTHFELRGARTTEGKRVSALEKSALDALREKCVQLDGELSLFDGVESVSSILQRVSKAREREGSHFTLDECQATLQHLSAYIGNVLKNPKDSRCWRIREANGTFQRQVGYLPYATELMESIGFELMQTLHGNAYTLRGTGMTKQDAGTSASLSNFAFTSVSSQMEWFLWRRKQEIDSLLEDEMRYLHDIVGNFPRPQNDANLVKEAAADRSRSDISEAQDAAVVKMYPYGTNAVETFNKTSIQRLQLDMMRRVFNQIDVDQKGFLVEADFSRAFGAPSALPTWSRCDAFDVGNDGQIDFTDFVAALGPLLDHTYELILDKNGEQVASFSGDDADLTLCEVSSLSVGNLRLGMSCAVAAAALHALLGHLFRVIQEPGNAALWSIDDSTAIGNKLLRFPAGRELLRLVGFRETTAASNDNSPGATGRSYELQPQRVRFKTSKTVSELPTTLDTATIARLQTIAAMLAGHYRGLKAPSVSDISAVSRAISTSERCSESWKRVVSLALKCLKNIESQPENPRYREINTATNTFTKIVGSVQGGTELLLSIGFRETDSGTLAIPSDVPLEVLKARRLELEVGLALLDLKSANVRYSEATPAQQKLERTLRNQTGRRNITDNGGPKGKPQTAQRSGANGVSRSRPVTATTLPAKNSMRPTKKKLSVKQRPQSAKPFNDPIEREIMSDFPHQEETKSRGQRASTLTRGRATTRGLSSKAATMGNDRGLSRKQVQRRAPNIPPPAGGHSMVLAEDAGIGSDTIVVQKGQFVLRGAYVRIGAELRDLYEERVVVEASTNDEHAPGLTKLRLGAPLRFFHPAKEMVSTVLLPSTELATRLEKADSETFARGIIFEFILNAVDQALLDLPCEQPQKEAEHRLSDLVTTVVTSFEPMNSLPIASANLRIGPSMRYLAAWGDKSERDDTTHGVSIVNDRLTNRKLQAYWEGLVLQVGTSNKKARLGDVKQLVRKNAHLSLLLSTARHELGMEAEWKLLDMKTEDFQLTYQEFEAFFRLTPKPGLVDLNEEENEARLQLPLAYLRKHFQILLQSTIRFTDGFKSVKAVELLQRVYKDVRDHPPTVSDDPNENDTGLETTQVVCQQLEKAFVGSQCTGHISWPELVYFVRYNKRLAIPEILPSVGSQLVLDSRMGGKQGSNCKEVAEVVAGMHSSRLLVLYFDGSVEVWSLSTNNAAQESKAMVLFSTKKRSSNAKEDGSESACKSFVQAWMDANQTRDVLSGQRENQADQASARVHQFKRSAGNYGALIRFCAWDSVVCLNSSILQETGSGSFRFFRLAPNFMTPIRQVTVGHVKVQLSAKTTDKKARSAKNGDCAVSSGVIKAFEVTTDGSKIVFVAGADTILWVACAGTGEILCHANLQASRVGKFRSFFQITEKRLLTGEVQTQLYATTSAKSYRHVGLWILSQGSEAIESFQRAKVFSFGKSKVSTVVHLVVSGNLLFVAARDGSVIVWSTSTDETSPVPALVCLQIPLHNEDLQSISCQSLDQPCRELSISPIHAGDSVAADIERWETEVLQRFKPPPLRFALYLFDDGEVIRLPVADQFDVKLLTLNDPQFEFDTFLAPVSGVEQNRARRVALHKQQITRILFMALHHSSNGIFAQKSVQAFFQDLENHEILWKRRVDMVKFALSYQENVVVELCPFYRSGDNESVELTHPRYLTQDDHETRKEKNSPVFVVGAILKARNGENAQFQTWKFALNWLADDVENELDAGRLNHAKKSLAQQSGYRIEAERLVRIRKDRSNEEHEGLMEDRRLVLVRDIKDRVRDIITCEGRPDEAAEELLKAVNVLTLASFGVLGRPDPLEKYLHRLFSRGSLKLSSDKAFKVSCTEIPSLVKLMQAEEGRNVCFGACLKRIMQTIVTTGKRERNTAITWQHLSLEACHLEACTVTTTEVGALFVDLGLVNAFTSSAINDHHLEQGFPPSSSLPTLVDQLHRFLRSVQGNENNLEWSMNARLSPRLVVEFIVECTNFSAFFNGKMADLSTRITKVVNGSDGQLEPEANYVFRLQMRKWQQELRQLAQSHNKLQSESTDCDLDVLEPMVEDLQQLQRFLKTPLPCVSPNLCSITLENRCDTIRCRDRFVMNAIGRLEGVGAEYVQLSVVHVFMERGEDAEKMYQQELTFLRKLQHLRTRKYFLPACLDISNAPILPSADASLVCTGDSDEIHCIVAESLRGWSSLSECIELLQLSNFSTECWKPLLWFWSRRVLMALLTMQNERFVMKRGIDLDMLLVSPDGIDLRLCSLAGGEFVRFSESGDDADSLSQFLAKVFGVFIFELLLRVFRDEIGGAYDENVSNAIVSDDNEDALRKMRSQVIQLLSKKSEDDENCEDRNSAALLTDFSSVSQMLACKEGTGVESELEKLCVLALIALQPSTTRPGLLSLWVFVDRPMMDVVSEESEQLKPMSTRMTTIVNVQRPLQKLLNHLLECHEACDDEEFDKRHLQRVVESWVALIDRLFQLKPRVFDRDGKKDVTSDQAFVQTLGETLVAHVPQQLSTIALIVFTQCSKSGDREQGRQAMQALLEGFANVIELIEANTTFDDLQDSSLLMSTAQQVLDCLQCVACGQMPPTYPCSQCEDELPIPSRYHRDVASNAVLWRLSEPVFRSLLEIEMASSKYSMLRRWLDSRRPPFGFTPMLLVGNEVDSCGSEGQQHWKQERALWWSDHAPQIPRHTPSSTAEDELIQKGYSSEAPTTTNYLRCLYETKEIEFKLTSGVSVPKFRLAALQQFFGPTFFERQRCFPMVFVQPLAATVWRDLAFERLICTLLRDGDEKIVLGALSLLECSTRVFRFDPLRSPRLRDATKTVISGTEPSYLYPCPERAFARHLCSQSVVIEVKRVLENTTRALKVLGESGTSSASRSQHPLVAILCVGMAWLVNCLYGGDIATQFWGSAGIDQLLLAHCKANSLPFVKMKDSNMMNSLFHQGQRLAQQYPVTASKWRVFTSGPAEGLSHRSASSRKCSPFKLMIEEIVFIGSNRAIGLMRILLLSRSFRELVAVDDSSTGARDSAFQRDLLSSSDYGKVSHAIDLARDITQLNGTTNEQVQLVVYARALFVYHTATSSRVRINVFAPVCREIWNWVGTAWRTIASHSCSSASEKSSLLPRAQGDVVISGLAFLYSIISHPSLLVGDIVELTAFDAGDSDEAGNVLHEMVVWIVNLPSGVLRRPGSTLAVLVESVVGLLVNSVRSRRYDEVALAVVTTCVDVRAVLELLGLACSSEATKTTPIVSVDEKQQLWSMLLYFDSRVITSRILDTDFLDTAVLSRLLGVDRSISSAEVELASLNDRLEAAMLLEVLVFAASRNEKSVNTQLLFAEVCKLVLNQDIIAKDAAYLRTTGDSSGINRKRVAVSKRVMQLVCCLCVDFSSQKASRVFLEQLESVGIPAWVVEFHQAQQSKNVSTTNDQLLTGVEIFWKDWQGRGTVTTTKSTNRTKVFESKRKSRSSKIIAQTAPRVQQSVSQTSTNHPTRKKRPSFKLESSDSERELVDVKRETPLVLVSPVKVANSVSLPRQLKQPPVRSGTTPSVIQTLLSIDADSALRLVKKPTAQKVPGKKPPSRDTDDEALDSDAYSPFPDESSSEEEARKRQRRAQHKARKSSKKKKKSRDAKGTDNKLERDSPTSSRSQASDVNSSTDGSPNSSLSSRERPRRRTNFGSRAVKNRLDPAPPAATHDRDALRPIFRKYDVDGDGFISFIDLRRAMDRQTSQRLSDLEIQRWISEKDRSGQGVVGFEDFCLAFQSQLQH